jgi:hypothetical protein
VRDRNRFHHFKNGLCSCRDFWWQSGLGDSWLLMVGKNLTTILEHFNMQSFCLVAICWITHLVQKMTQQDIWTNSVEHLIRLFGPKPDPFWYSMITVKGP